MNHPGLRSRPSAPPHMPVIPCDCFAQCGSNGSTPEQGALLSSDTARDNFEVALDSRARDLAPLMGLKELDHQSISDGEWMPF
jgi:hypothetical protein